LSLRMQGPSEGANLTSQGKNLKKKHISVNNKEMTEGSTVHQLEQKPAE